jgi:hypothetical protein
MDVVPYEVKEQKIKVKYGKIAAKHGAEDMIRSISILATKKFINQEQMDKANLIYQEICKKLTELNNIVND